MNAIAEISTSDLIDELMSRCSPCIFIGKRTEEYDDGSKDTNWWSYLGNLHSCYGLAQELASRIQEEILQGNLEEKDDG